MAFFSSPLWEQIQQLSLEEKQQLFGMLYWSIQQQQEPLDDDWPLFDWQRKAIMATQMESQPRLSEGAFRRRMEEKLDNLPS